MLFRPVCLASMSANAERNFGARTGYSEGVVGQINYLLMQRMRGASRDRHLPGTHAKAPTPARQFDSLDVTIGREPGAGVTACQLDYLQTPGNLVSKQSGCATRIRHCEFGFQSDVSLRRPSRLTDMTQHTRSTCRAAGITPAECNNSSPWNDLLAHCHLEPWKGG